METKMADETIIGGESNKAKIGVFWNIDDCPIPEGLDHRKIFENIKLSLANENYDHAQVSIQAYCEKENPSFDKLSLTDDNITFIPIGNQLTRFKIILEDIFLWALQNPSHKSGTIHKVVVISKIPQDLDFCNHLDILNSSGYNVLFAVPDSLAYVSSVWLWPALTYRVKTIEDQSGVKLNEAMTPVGVFWNFDDHPVAKGVNPLIVRQNISSALTINGYHGAGSISAYSVNYGSMAAFAFYLSHCGITLQNKVVKNAHGRDSAEVDQMLVDIVLWAIDNPAPSNLLVISKDISEETDLLRILRALESKDYKILVAQSEEAAAAVICCTESSKWHLQSLTSLFGGGNPIDQSREACNTTSVFWDIEDCPVPGFIDRGMFLQLIKTSLADHGHNGKVSITAYCEKNRSLNEFSSSDIRFVPTGDNSARSKKMFDDILFYVLENQKASNVILITKTIPDNVYNVLLSLIDRDINVLFAEPHCNYYAKSVWLWPTLAGGGKCID